MTDKVKLEFRHPPKKTFTYNQIEIEVNPFIDTGEQVAIANDYVAQYFGIQQDPFIKGSDYNYLEAEYSLMFHLLQMKTNVDIEDFDSNLFSDVDFIHIFTSQFVNYVDFKNKLGFIVNEIKQQQVIKNSVGAILQGLSEKLYALLDKIGDITPEQIEALQKTGVDLLNQLNESPLVKDMNNTAPALEQKT